ncbi:HNH endonuclease [Leptospira sp. GIMC2001]|uniref:HNH endonuclease n=1 Tax=Leptospira sp. GIMC2001 TaxID=1513297 RepID=UPI003FA55D9F
MKTIFEKINRPYKKLKNDNLLIRLNYFDYKDWDKGIFSNLKEKIKNHLRKEQNNQCCYCRSKLGFDIRQTEIEHIIAKSKEKNFTFISKNLALCCPGCNSSKSTKNVLKRLSQKPLEIN